MLDSFKMAGALAGLMKNKDALRTASDRVKARLAEVRVTGSAGGGAVTATVSGEMRVVSIQLGDALAQSLAGFGSREKGQALIAEAINDALIKAQAVVQKELTREAKELGLPSIPGLEGLLGG